MTSQRRTRRLLALLAVLALTLGACGGDDDGDVAAGDGDTTDTTEAADTTDTTEAADDTDDTETTGAAADGDGAADADVNVVAEDIDFPQKQFEAPAGEVTIAYENQGQIRHTLVVEDAEGWEKLEVDENGAVATGSIDLEPGEYTLFCDVSGHREAGMEATLTVQ